MDSTITLDAAALLCPAGYVPLFSVYDDDRVWLDDDFVGAVTASDPALGGQLLALLRDRHRDAVRSACAHNLRAPDPGCRVTVRALPRRSDVSVPLPEVYWAHPVVVRAVFALGVLEECVVFVPEQHVLHLRVQEHYRELNTFDLDGVSFFRAHLERALAHGPVTAEVVAELDRVASLPQVRLSDLRRAELAA